MIEIKKRIVINTDYGGYSLSVKAQLELAKRKNIILEKKDDFYCVEGSYQTISQIIPRDDEDLIAVVEEMGKEANGTCAKLKIVEAVAYIEITNHDGKEDISGYIHQEF